MAKPPTTKSAPKEEVWIGLVCLKPLPEPRRVFLSEGMVGAFTNIVTWARDVDSFRCKAEMLAADYCMYVVDVENAEPASFRLSHSTMDEGIQDLIEQAQSNPNAILFATMHQYPHEEA